MRSRAALSGVSRSWYRFVFWDSIDSVLWFVAVLADRFYVFCLRRSNRNDHRFLRYLQGRCRRKYLDAWLTMPDGHTWQMELRHLRYFVAVAEEQNVTRAAVRLHLSQPTLSRQIRDLEDELGIVLFERGAKTVRLTEAGRVLLTEARIALQGVQDAVQMAKAVAGGKRAEIHVGYAPSLTVELLPR